MGGSLRSKIFFVLISLHLAFLARADDSTEDWGDTATHLQDTTDTLDHTLGELDQINTDLAYILQELRARRDLPQQEPYVALSEIRALETAEIIPPLLDPTIPLIETRVMGLDHWLLECDYDDLR